MADSTTIPVNPAVLKWARETAGYSKAEAAAALARKLKRKKPITERDLRGWETTPGAKSARALSDFASAPPTVAELRALSKVYQRPMEVFFLAEVPEEPFPKDFRTTPKSVRRPLSPEARLEIRRVVWLQAVAAELHEDMNLEPVRLPRASLDNDSEEWARHTRKLLEMTLDQQEKYRDAAQALRDWRRRIESTGVLTFRVPFPRKELEGVALPHPVVPCVAIGAKETVDAMSATGETVEGENKKPKQAWTSAQRQSFTLFHEYAHLLLRTEPSFSLPWNVGRSATTEVARTERFCNRFAGAVLFPREAADGVRSATGDEIEDLARRLKISRQVVAIRLANLGKMSQAACDSYRQRVEEEEAPRAPKDQREIVVLWWKRRLNERGGRFARLVLEAWQSGTATLSDACEYLGVQVQYIDAIEAEAYHR